MGGMFTVVKVRQGLAKNDYKDPGWYKHPEGTVAYEWKGAKLAEAPRARPRPTAASSRRIARHRSAQAEARRTAAAAAPEPASNH